MTVNETLLRRTVEAIQEDTSRWEQTHWVDLVDSADPACGTTLCFAGFASCLAGAEFVDPEEHETYDGERYYFQPSLVVTPEGYEEHVETYAQDVLGLDPEQAWALFHTNYGNDLDVLVDTVDRIISGEIAEGADFDVA